jgi:Protein of unknown function (DUF2510)
MTITEKPPAAGKKVPAKAAAKKAMPARKVAAPVTNAPPAPPAGWYQNPDDATQSRYWDGAAWLGKWVPTDMVPAADPTPATVQGEPAPAKAADRETRANRAVIEFGGRTMNVHMPSPEQLAVWKRIASRLSSADFTTPPGADLASEEARNRANEEAATLLGRAITIITSVLDDPVDRDWVEDSILDGTLDLVGSTGIITATIDEFRKMKPATASTTGPAPKARRRR